MCKKSNTVMPLNKVIFTRADLNHTSVNNSNETCKFQNSCIICLKCKLLWNKDFLLFQFKCFIIFSLWLSDILVYLCDFYCFFYIISINFYYSNVSLFFYYIYPLITIFIENLLFFYTIMFLLIILSHS